MGEVVSATTGLGKPFCGIFTNTGNILRMTDVASLLMRDPMQAGAIWSLWERASPGERAQIETIAEALISARKRA